MSDLEKRFPVYSKLLHLYPLAYQQTYADDLLQTTADMLDDTESSWQRSNVWLRIAFELPKSVTKQQVQERTKDMRHTSALTQVALALGILGFIVGAVLFEVAKSIHANYLFNGAEQTKSQNIKYIASWVTFLSIILIAFYVIGLFSRRHLQKLAH